MPGNGKRHEDLIEYHQIPHGYVHPKEYHHWWWYAGLLAVVLSCALIGLIYWQFDQAEAPLCSRQIDSVVASPGGTVDLVLMHASCLGGAVRQNLVLRKADGGNRTVVSFDDAATIRYRWVSDSEIAVTQKGGKVLTFEPSWGGVHVHYH